MPAAFAALALVADQNSPIKIFLQAPIPLFVITIVRVAVAPNPVFRTQGPRFNDAWNSIQSPMNDHSKLLILPFIQFLFNERIRWPLISWKQDER